MDKEQIQKALTELKQQPQKKFTQSYDLIINLKNLVIKSHPVDFFVTLRHPKGKTINVAAFVAQELSEQASKFCDFVIKESDFAAYDKKKAKQLAEDYDFFIAQANMMGKLAGTFGKALGVKGKMPNPKLGCVVPPNANLEALVKKLRLTVRLQAKKGTNLQCMVGKQDQPDDQIIENILAVYEAALKQLPEEAQNIKNTTLKLTMGKPVKI